MKVYQKRSCNSSRQTLVWLKAHHVDIEKRQIEQITREVVVQLLSFTDKGFSEIIKNKHRSGREIYKKLVVLDTLSFNDGVDYLLENPTLFKTPIVLDNSKYMIGYNIEEIRQFIPGSFRKQNRNHTF